jgi:hypothetical protein
MKIKLIQLGVGILLTLGCVSTGLGQMPQWFEIINVPVASGSARLHMAEMRKALPYLLSDTGIPTNGVPVVAQVEYQYDPWILPETLVSSSDFRSWRGVEIPKRTTDPVLKPFKNQKGNSVGAILSFEGDGTALPVKSLVVRAQIWDPQINDYIAIKPSRVLLEGLVYRKDREGSLRTDEDGNLLKPHKYVFGSLGSLKKSRLKIDAFNLFIQFDSKLGIDASSMPGSTNEEKIGKATQIVADNLGEVHVYAGFISHPDTEDEEILFEDFTFFWLLPPD